MRNVPTLPCTAARTGTDPAMRDPAWSGTVSGIRRVGPPMRLSGVALRDSPSLALSRLRERRNIMEWIIDSSQPFRGTFSAAKAKQILKRYPWEFFQPSDISTFFRFE